MKSIELMLKFGHLCQTLYDMKMLFFGLANIYMRNTHKDNKNMN